MSDNSASTKKKSRETLVAPTADEQASRNQRRQVEVKEKREKRLKTAERNKRQTMLTRIAIGVVGVLIVGGIGFAIFNSVNNADANSIPKGTVTYDNTSRAHDDSYDSWPQSPPTGGTHNSVWQNCGYYAGQVGKGHAVHSLEHGAIWITYLPGTSPDVLDKLKSLAESETYILVSEYPGQAAPIVMTAWNHQLNLQTIDDARFDQFIKVFRTSEKYTPELGAVCTNGVSDIIGS
jgi:hypothetical protein